MPRLLAALLSPTAALLGSCGEPTAAGRVPVHQARGRVLYKGRPLADALVVLRPADPAAPLAGGGASPTPRPTGRTDREGAFRLHTYAAADGAPAGAYRVGISVAPATTEVRDFLKKGSATPRRAPDVPGVRFGDPETSGLKAEIRPGDNEIPPFRLD
jgi:hypothetical protein